MNRVLRLQAFLVTTCPCRLAVPVIACLLGLAPVHAMEPGTVQSTPGTRGPNGEVCLVSLEAHPIASLATPYGLPTREDIESPSRSEPIVIEAAPPAGFHAENPRETSPAKPHAKSQLQERSRLLTLFPLKPTTASRQEASASVAHSPTMVRERVSPTRLDHFKRRLLNGPLAWNETLFGRITGPQRNRKSLAVSLESESRRTIAKKPPAEGGRKTPMGFSISGASNRNGQDIAQHGDAATSTATKQGHVAQKLRNRLIRAASVASNLGASPKPSPCAGKERNPMDRTGSSQSLVRARGNSAQPAKSMSISDMTTVSNTAKTNRIIDAPSQLPKRSVHDTNDSACPSIRLVDVTFPIGPPSNPLRAPSNSRSLPDATYPTTSARSDLPEDVCEKPQIPPSSPNEALVSSRNGRTNLAKTPPAGIDPTCFEPSGMALESPRTLSFGIPMRALSDADGSIEPIDEQNRGGMAELRTPNDHREVAGVRSSGPSAEQFGQGRTTVADKDRNTAGRHSTPTIDADGFRVAKEVASELDGQVPSSSTRNTLHHMPREPSLLPTTEQAVPGEMASRDDRTPARELRVDFSGRVLLRFEDQQFRAHVDDPEICEVLHLGRRGVAVRGKQPGQTLVHFSGEEGAANITTYRVNVGPDEKQQQHDQNSCVRLRKLVGGLFPASQVNIISDRGRLIVTGRAKDAQEAAKIMSLIRQARPLPVVDRLTVGTSPVSRPARSFVRG